MAFAVFACLMRFAAYILFLVFFILTGVLILGNLSYRADEYFFLAPFQGQSLALPFLGFAVLGILTGIFFVLSLAALFPRRLPTMSPSPASSVTADEE